MSERDAATAFLCGLAGVSNPRLAIEILDESMAAFVLNRRDAMLADGDGFKQRPMIPSTLTDDDLRDCALACRAMAVQWLKDAEQQQNPAIKDQFYGQAQRFRALAERFEEERKQ